MEGCRSGNLEARIQRQSVLDICERRSVLRPEDEMADLQIATSITKVRDTSYEAVAYVTTEHSRSIQIASDSDESKRMAVAFAIAARIGAIRAHHLEETPLKVNNPPQVGRNVKRHGSDGWRSYWYVKLSTLNGTREEAATELKVLDQAVKGFKLSDIGL